MSYNSTHATDEEKDVNCDINGDFNTYTYVTHAHCKSSLKWNGLLNLFETST